ncbi:hypothetical protein [Streptomyces sp. NPDC059168]|uniref:hypothetical protein n=1 Tax=Streptomyces sp. NPDC059168 TaxID=3346753 RepID=UPI00367D6677
MGERLSGEGLPARRRGHPGGTALGSAPAGPDTGFEARVGAALRGDGSGGVDPEAERRAVAAFRTARDSGQRRARTRRRDDWRPGRPRGARLPVRTTLSVFLASLTLGGVAFATMGAPGFDGHDDDGGGTGPPRTPPPASTAPRQQSAGPDRTAAPSAGPHHPGTAEDMRAHCRAYEQVRGRGRALDATAWRRLVAAAGGEDAVAGYCAARATPSAQPSHPGNGTAGGTAGGGGGGSDHATADTSRGGGGSGPKAADPERAEGKK